MIAFPKETSLIKLVECVHNRGTYGDKNFPQISRRLHDIDIRKLVEQNVSYHWKCYQDIINVSDISRAKKIYEQATAQKSNDYIAPKVGRPSHSTVYATASAQGLTMQVRTSQPRTRSSFHQFNKDLCFFCQGASSVSFLEMCPFNAGRRLKEAVDASGNDKWKVRLSTAMDAEDARAIDVKYHLPCWVKNVQRRPSKEADNSILLGESSQNKVTSDTVYFYGQVIAL